VAYRVLILEDRDTNASDVLAALQGSAEFACERIEWAAFAPEKLGSAAADAIVAVPNTSKADAVFESLRRRPIATPVFTVLPSDAGELLRMAMETADDFIVAPIRPNELRQRLARLVGPSHHLDAVRERLLEEMGLGQLVGNDDAFVRVVAEIPRLASMDLPVLITGETGTGKEVCAHAIHHLGRRRNAPFVAVDCGAVPDHLFENELFGHARGAFTDAHRDQRGVIAMAEGGTLFLDEIGSLLPPAQGKLLRFLQEHTFRPLGAERFQRANVNVIAALNRDLESCVREKEFRADLYYRLNVLRLHLPPLRERRGDIALLAAHFLNGRRASMPKAPRSFSPAAIRLLELYDWPGNVRELANVVDRAIVTCDGGRILPCHITLPTPKALAPCASSNFRAARGAVVVAFERDYIEALLRKHDGNVTHAAREAQKDRRAFGRLMKKHAVGRTAG
jgi:DNA-binding NtrC family response regulator